MSLFVLFKDTSMKLYNQNYELTQTDGDSIFCCIMEENIVLNTRTQNTKTRAVVVQYVRANYWQRGGVIRFNQRLLFVLFQFVSTKY